MLFRDDEQRLRVCRALLATGGLQRYWTARGPTDKARAAATGVPTSEATLSPGDRALLLSAWAFWSGAPNILRFDELLALPEAEPICKLTIAALYGPRAIDAWLTRSVAREGYVACDVAEVHDRAANLYDAARAAFGELGSDAMNFSQAADACALGAYQMARMLLCAGAAVRPVADDEAGLHKASRSLTLQVLGLLAAESKREARAARRRLRGRGPKEV